MSAKYVWTIYPKRYEEDMLTGAFEEEDPKVTAYDKWLAASAHHFFASLMLDLEAGDEILIARIQ